MSAANDNNPFTGRTELHLGHQCGGCCPSHNPLSTFNYQPPTSSTDYSPRNNSGNDSGSFRSSSLPAMPDYRPLIAAMRELMTACESGLITEERVRRIYRSDDLDTAIFFVKLVRMANKGSEAQRALIASVLHSEEIEHRDEVKVMDALHGLSELEQRGLINEESLKELRGGCFFSDGRAFLLNPNAMLSKYADEFALLQDIPGVFERMSTAENNEILAEIAAEREQIEREKERDDEHSRCKRISESLSSIVNLNDRWGYKWPVNGDFSKTHPPAAKVWGANYTTEMEGRKLRLKEEWQALASRFGKGKFSSEEARDEVTKLLRREAERLPHENKAMILAVLGLAVQVIRLKDVHSFLNYKNIEGLQKKSDNLLKLIREKLRKDDRTKSLAEYFPEEEGAPWLRCSGEQLQGMLDTLQSERWNGDIAKAYRFSESIGVISKFDVWALSGKKGPYRFGWLPLGWGHEKRLSGHRSVVYMMDLAWGLICSDIPLERLAPAFSKHPSKIYGSLKELLRSIAGIWGSGREVDAALLNRFFNRISVESPSPKGT